MSIQDSNSQMQLNNILTEDSNYAIWVDLLFGSQCDSCDLDLQSAILRMVVLTYAIRQIDYAALLQLEIVSALRQVPAHCPDWR